MAEKSNTEAWTKGSGIACLGFLSPCAHPTMLLTYPMSSAQLSSE